MGTLLTMCVVAIMAVPVLGLGLPERVLHPAPLSALGMMPRESSSTNSNEAFDNWTQVCATCAPPARQGQAQVYDAKDGYTLMFGGTATGSSRFGDTWIFQHGAWTQLSPAIAPSPRQGAMMVYDPIDGYVVLFGGLDSSGTLLNDTWTFSGGVWTHLSLSHAPSPRSSPAFTWDAQDGYALLFGGCGTSACNSALYNDTWTFLGGKWTQLPLSHAPSPRGWVGMTYDATAHDVLLFGGYGPGYVALADTWTYSAGAWTQLFPSVRPTARTSTANLVFDNDHAAPLLFGGASNGTYLNDTWEFVSGDWTPILTTHAPGPRSGVGMDYDPNVGYLLLFGGGDNSGAAGDTWVLGPWLPPPDILSFSAAPGLIQLGASSALRATLAAGPLPVSLAYAGLPIGCSSANSTSLTCAPTSTGNFTIRVWANDTLHRSATAVTTLAVVAPLTVSATPSKNPSEVGLAVSFQAVCTGGNGSIAYDWSFGDGGSLHNSISTVGHTYTSSGSFHLEVWANDTAGGHASANLTMNILPALKATLTANPNPTTIGSPVAFDASASGGKGPMSYAWNFGDGGLGGNLQNITHIYTTNGPFTATVSVTDAIGAVANASVPISVALEVQVNANVTIGAAPLVAGFTSTVSGGVPGYTYAWSFGDGSTSSIVSPSHLYASVGTFQAKLTVKDSVGHEATSYWNVTTVQGGSSLSVGVSASPSQLILGNSTVITATVGGGHGDYSIAWLNVPSWCLSTSITTLNCLPTATGTFTFKVEVVDSLGATAQGQTYVTVSAHAVGPSSPSRGLFGLPPVDGYLIIVAVLGAVAAAAILAAYTSRRGMIKGPTRTDLEGSSDGQAWPKDLGPGTSPKKPVPPSGESDTLRDLF